MSLKAILQAIIVVLGLIRDFFHSKEIAESKQAGRDEAVIEGRKQQDDALDRTQAAIDESDKKPIDYRD